jgi:hypothetical protein
MHTLGRTRSMRKDVTVNTELESKLKELNRRGRCTYSWHMFSNAASDRDRYTNTPLVN